MTEDLKLLRLTSDTLFKAFMMSNYTKKYKARLIYLITGLEEERLLNAAYQSREFAVENKKDKVYKSDIIVNVDKNVLLLEMNQSYYPEIIEKNFKYLNKVSYESYNSGEDYDNRICIQVNFDDYDSYQKKKLIYHFEMMEVNEHFIDQLNYRKYHISLSNLRKKCYTDNASEELINILKIFTVKTLEELESLRGEDYMDEAISEIKRICQDEKIIGLYDKEEEERRVKNCQMRYAKNQGIEEGKIEIVKNMLKENIDISLISKVTGLSKEEIEKLE